MSNSTSKKVLAAMSGGVDSSVTALLLKEAGYDVIGVTMKLYDNELVDPGSYTCCTADDAEDARRVANGLGFNHYVFNLSGDFEEKVICRFVSAYENGATPNPCIDCNRYIKFEKLYKRGFEIGCDYIATGHYAQIEKTPGGRYLLKKGVDSTKDQSYVLWSLTQDQLAHTLFPLGGLTKTETREIAEAHGFANAHKHDSQDICFVPDGDYTSFIRRYTGKDYPEGDFVDLCGNVLGTHRGIIRYTIGQRKGLGLALPHPMYVVKKDLENNRVILGENSDLFTRELIAEDMNWIAFDAPQSAFRCNGRVRYSSREASCEVFPLSGTKVHVVFDEPQRAITAGQSLVLYDGDIVVGGGTIL